MPRNVKYYGGKGRPGLNQWIRAHLPENNLQEQTYVEPFAGMLSVLLHRPPAGREIASDLDKRVWNWHCCVRDHAEELARLIDETHCTNQNAVDWGRENMDNEELSPCKRALAFYLAVDMSFLHAPGRPGTPLKLTTAWRPPGTAIRPMLPRQVYALRDRLKNVQMLNEDCAKILKRSAVEPAAVVYVDPPYGGANTDAYNHLPDREKLASLLMAQTGFCAISGYGEDWDHLGWHRHEMEVAFIAARPSAREARPSRTEVLWCNREIRKPGFRFF